MVRKKEVRESMRKDIAVQIALKPSRSVVDDVNALEKEILRGESTLRTDEIPSERDGVEDNGHNIREQ